MENNAVKNKEETKEAISIDNKSGIARITLNPLVYDLDVIYTTAYIFLEKAYVILDGNPKKEIIVSLKPKEKLESDKDLKQLSYEFMDHLIITEFSKIQNKDSADIKSLILKKIIPKVLHIKARRVMDYFVFNMIIFFNYYIKGNPTFFRVNTQ